MFQPIVVLNYLIREVSVGTGLCKDVGTTFVFPAWCSILSVSLPCDQTLSRGSQDGLEWLVSLMSSSLGSLSGWMSGRYRWQAMSSSLLLWIQNLCYLLQWFFFFRPKKKVCYLPRHLHANVLIFRCLTCLVTCKPSWLFSSKHSWGYSCINQKVHVDLARPQGENLGTPKELQVILRGDMHVWTATHPVVAETFNSKCLTTILVAPQQKWEDH